MQADEFEKKIQHKMEGFELVPDSEVWKQVSFRIENEKKNRRVVFYWLFAGFVLLAGTSALWVINNENKSNLVINNVNNNISKGENYKIKQNKPNSSQSLNKVQKARTEKDIAYVKKDEVKHVSGAEVKNKALTKIRFQKVIDKELRVNRGKDNSNIYNEEKQLSKSLPPHRFYNPELAPTAKTDTAPGNTIGNKKTNFKKDTSANTIAETNRIKGQINKKWNVGFTVYSGISNNLSGLPLLEKSYAQEYFYSPGSPANTGNYNFTTNASSNFKIGLSYGLGIFSKKQLTNKISLSAGVDYHLYTAKSTVGSKVNQQRSFYDSLLQKATSVNGYFTLGSSTSYSNKYHMVQVPINMEYRINKNQEKPLMVSAGISPGYLLGSNALYANPSANVYYVDKEKFHSFQLFAQMGFLFTVKSSDKYLISAGPAVQYGITNAAKAVTGTNQHLFFTGIKANIILK